jgi:hypothetical protein
VAWSSGAGDLVSVQADGPPELPPELPPLDPPELPPLEPLDELAPPVLLLLLLPPQPRTAAKMNAAGKILLLMIPSVILHGVCRSIPSGNTVLAARSCVRWAAHAAVFVVVDAPTSR